MNCSIYYNSFSAVVLAKENVDFGIVLVDNGLSDEAKHVAIESLLERMHLVMHKKLLVVIDEENNGVTDKELATQLDLPVIEHKYSSFCDVVVIAESEISRVKNVL